MSVSEPELVSARLDVRPARVSRMCAWLCGAERVRASRYRSERLRRRFIVARARLRELLGERLGAAPESIEFRYGVSGKPALGGRFAASGLRFNLSHCEDVAVYAFAAGEVGVDVEALRPLPEADGIAARFFSPGENRAYLALPARDRPLGFFNCWTRKEAFVKALGGGLSLPLDEFDVSLAPDEPPRLLRIGGAAGGAPAWRLRSFSPFPGFIAALAIHP